MHTRKRNFPSLVLPSSLDFCSKKAGSALASVKKEEIEEAPLVVQFSTPRADFNTRSKAKKICGWNKQYTTLRAHLACTFLWTQKTSIRWWKLEHPPKRIKNGNEKAAFCSRQDEVLFLMSGIRFYGLFCRSIMHIILIKNSVDER